MTKPTVTIGIPAYNEGNNIGYLIVDLLNQNTESFTLDNIVISSDASTDNTDEIVESFSDKIVKLIKNNIREGQGVRQNQIINSCNSDILVLLNADILIEDCNFIEELIKPILLGADLVCGPLMEISPTNLIEKVICFGSIYKRTVFEKYNGGNNIFTCHGSHRAFSKNLYKKFRFVGSIAEDAYSYLYCIKEGFKYAYTNKAKVCIKLPSNLRDHKNQSSRFFNSQNKLSMYFDTNFINKNYKWPVSLLIKEFLKLFLIYPVESILYVFISAYIMITSKIGLNEKKDTWSIVSSSKVLRN